jgi:hypothetical protein
MNSRSVKSLALLATFCATSLFAASKTPDLFIKTIRNTTPYDILLVDRLTKNNSVILPARKTTETSFKVNDQNRVIMNGNMADCMGKDAQYVFIKLDQNGNPEPGQEVYFNMYISPGGVDNGSGFTTGTLGSLSLNFYVAGKNGGCMMNCRKIDVNENEIAEFELELSMSAIDIRSNLFRMNINGKLTCK